MQLDFFRKWQMSPKAKEERKTSGFFEATVIEGNECRISWNYGSYW
jgi:hypothetical protein